ncbi:MAG: nucleolar RNA-binding Nop10p family protein [Candidatus Pacearchaeota archaeon]
MSLKKCPNCQKYTFKETCQECGENVNEASYKFKNVRDAPPVNDPREVQKKHKPKKST